MSGQYSPTTLGENVDERLVPGPCTPVVTLPSVIRKTEYMDYGPITYGGQEGLGTAMEIAI
jgi:hypothetical protein